MVKGILFVSLFLGIELSCAAYGTVRNASDSLFSTESPGSCSNIWFKKMRGVISGLSLSQDGRVILVATNPDKDIEGSSDDYQLTLLDAQGHLRWQKKMQFPVKEQDVADNGLLSVVSNYENEVLAFGPKGQLLWTVEGICRPIVLSASKKILCYHDDDADPGFGFDVYDWNGKKALSYPIDRDILAFKLSQDEKNLVLALTQGSIILLDSKFQKVWQKKVPGEVIDVAVSASKTPHVAVLFQPESSKKEQGKQVKLKQGLAVFDQAGNPLTEVSPSFHAIQLEFDPQGNALFYYGSGSDGQNIASLDLATWKESWRRGTKTFSDYAYSISVSNRLVLMGVEEVTSNYRKSHLLAFGHDGKKQWDLPLKTLTDGAYLYSHRMSSGGSLLVVGTDDAQLGAYRISR